jgi:hypothetical protein
MVVGLRQGEFNTFEFVQIGAVDKIVKKVVLEREIPGKSKMKFNWRPVRFAESTMDKGWLIMGKIFEGITQGNKCFD